MTLSARWSIIAALAMVAAGCASSATSPSPFGEPFDLRVGQSATIEGRLTIAFERVLSDSRCPMDAICVWAGDAVARVALIDGRSDPDTRELHTALGGSETSFRDYVIALKSLAPYPQSARKIAPGEYVATLTVSAQ